MNSRNQFPNDGYVPADWFLTEDDQMMNRDLASPQYAAQTARSEVLRVLELMKHLYPGSDLQTMAQVAYDMICQIDDQLE